MIELPIISGAIFRRGPLPFGGTMTDEARMIGYVLLKTATLVRLRVLSEEVLDVPGDAAEFGLRLELKFIPHEDEDEVAEAIAEWGAFGSIFALGVLPFAEGKLRNLSEFEYEETDEFKLGDFIEGLRLVRGKLHFDADYIRRRWIKTCIVARSNGTIMLQTIGRGKPALRRLDQLKGKKLMRPVGQ